jgi:hypothetical protein
VELTQVEPLTKLPSMVNLQAFPANIRRGQKWSAVMNALDYNASVLIKDVKKFYGAGPAGWSVICQFRNVSYAMRG